MPDIRNCRRCGKVYTYLGGPPLCQACKQLDEEDFKRVKDYLYKNPGASISHISNTLEISVEKIKRFLKEGRLEITDNEGNLFLECERCGKAIKSGRLCDDCEKELEHGFKTAASQISSKAQSEARKGYTGIRYLSKEDHGDKKDKK